MQLPCRAPDAGGGSRTLMVGRVRPQHALLPCHTRHRTAGASEGHSSLHAYSTTSGVARTMQVNANMLTLIRCICQSDGFSTAQGAGHKEPMRHTRIWRTSGCIPFSRTRILLMCTTANLSVLSEKSEEIHLASTPLTVVSTSAKVNPSPGSQKVRCPMGHAHPLLDDDPRASWRPIAALRLINGFVMLLTWCKRARS